MITKMKKLTFIVTNREKQSFLEELRSLGVVHIVELRKDIMSDELQQAMDADARFKQALQILTEARGEAAATGTANASRGAQVVEQVFNLHAQKQSLQQRIKELDDTIRRLAPFGDFSVEDLAEVEQQSGLTIDFFCCSAKTYQKEWEDLYFATPVAKDKAHVWFATFAANTPEIAAEHIERPAANLAHVKQEKASAGLELAEVQGNMQQLAIEDFASVEAAQKENLSNIAMSRAKLSSEELVEGAAHLLEGWVPANNAAEVCTALDKSGICYEMTAPAADDDVPIKLRNDRFASIYETITKMYGFPSYQEWDPTLLVAPFFTLFFAICMGDAGYGILILAYGILESMGKAKNVPILGDMLKGCGAIITILGATTFVIGCCLGTFFGMNLVEIGWIPADSAFGQMVTWLGGTIPGTNYSIQMAAALAIGAFHISLAMIVKAALYSQRYGFKSQISVWSWVLLLVGGVITVLLGMTSVLSEDATKIVLIAIAAVSAVGIFLLNDLKRNPLINVGAGLLSTYNMVTGLLGDLLSYLRLYALCLAGGMLGAAFNMMGQMVIDLGAGLPGYVTPLLWFFAIVIFIFGHVFNVLMSSISAFVHPLRLIFVEYFKNSGYEGQGHEYKPFK